MRRKVIQHGPTTLTISLPKPWVIHNQVLKGDELDIHVNEKELIISKEAQQQDSSISVDISDLDRTTIMFTLRSLYRLGYDRLELTFQRPMTTYQPTGEELSLSSIIHLEVNRLMGYEVIQESASNCVIKDLQDISAKDFEQVMRRIFLLIIDAFKCLKEGVSNNDINLLRTLENKHDTITKFVSYCMRIIHKANPIDNRKADDYYYIASYLDRITDIIKYTARDICDKKLRYDKDDISIIEEVSAAFEEYYSIFYSFNNKGVLKINSHRYQTKNLLAQVSSQKKPGVIIGLTNLTHITDMLIDLVGARIVLEY